MDYHSCELCPRMCRADRTSASGPYGFCKMTSTVRAARAALHMWEEPSISGINGSGTVFFSGCTLRCCFCQNYKISSGQFGKELSVRQLADVFLNLQEQGAHNINLVTATHFLPSVLKALDLVRSRLVIPVVYNCGGYERAETIRELDGYVDIYLPDLKYYSSELSEKYSGAPDYFSAASTAISEMISQTGSPRLENYVSDSGKSCLLMKKGVIIRHMVLPGQKEDSKKLLSWIRENLPENGYYISLMSQYTPYYENKNYPELNRRITSYEYNQVVDYAIELGLTDGYMQKKSSAKEEYTPPFDLEGLI